MLTAILKFGVFGEKWCFQEISDVPLCMFETISGTFGP
jgi:hypothetical protein